MPLRFVAIGDSTVEGLEDPGPDGSYVGWADRLAAHLDAAHPGLLYANLAVRGQTTDEVRRTQLRPAVAMAPDIAVVVAGVNNVLRPRMDRDALRADLFAMHSDLAMTGARVLTFSMPDMTRVAPLAAVLGGRLRFLNDVTYECRDRFGSLVLDLAAEPVASHPALWHTDRLHANSEGHRRIAEGLAELVGCDVPDWRAEPPDVHEPALPRVVAGEVGWVVSHLLPWAWGHVRGHSSGEEVTCKRPQLQPVAG